MTRIRYKDTGTGIISSVTPFILGNTMVRVHISKESLMFYIMTSNKGLGTIYTGKCNSVRMCKVNAKIKLQEIGVIFQTEVRRTR